MSQDMPVDMTQAARLLGAKGGRKRAKNLTPAQRAEIAAKGGRAKATKHKHKKK
jgi:hypothetical protein